MRKPDDMSSLTLDVVVNGVTHTAPVSATLHDLVGALGHRPDSIATALNGEFVARDRRHERILNGGDVVTCFQVIVGG